MWTFTTFRDHAARSGGGAVRLITVVQRQPSWVARAALGAGMVVFAGVVLLLVIPATLVVVTIFAVLALCTSTARAIRSSLGIGRSGRRNVRVITRR